MARFRAVLARTRRVWLPLAAIGLAAWGFSVATANWFDESSLAEAWILFTFWVWVVSIFTALAYESVRPVLEDERRDRMRAGLVYALSAFPLVALVAVLAYAALLPSNQGLSFDVGLDRAFLVAVIFFMGPALLSTVLAAGFSLAHDTPYWRRVLYWAAAAFVLAFPVINPFDSGELLYEEGGGLLALGLMALLAPVLVGLWKRKRPRKGPERLYPA